MTEPEGSTPQGCECKGPGFCPRRGHVVTEFGHRICRAGNPGDVASYFDGMLPAAARAMGMATTTPAAEARARRPLSCAYLGAAVRGEDGRQATRQCGTCRGSVRLKVFECGHPGHAGDPTTTERDCGRCGDWREKGQVVEIGAAAGVAGTNSEMNHWRGG